MPRFRRVPIALVLISSGLVAGACDDLTQPILPPDSPPSFSVGDSLLPAGDSYIWNDEPNGHWGEPKYISVIAGSDVTRGLIQFDQDSIAGVVGTGTLDSAVLEVTIAVLNVAIPITVSTHRMTQPWMEFQTTWLCANDPVDNGELDCAPGDLWDMDTAGEWPFVATATDSESIAVPLTDSLVQFDVTVDIQNFMSGQAFNYGWLLKNSDEQAVWTSLHFWSKDALGLGYLEAVAPRLALFVSSQGTPPTVPAIVPDSQPAFMLDDTKLVSSGDLSWRTDVLLLGFHDGATQAQKDSALTAVNGTVVGGFNVTHSGIYYIKIPEDGTDGPLHQAIATLKQMPQVRLAVPFFLQKRIRTAWVAPTDGASYGAGDWDVIPDRAGGANWGLERIAAPLAWGCSVGEATVEVTVLDHYFNTTTDLTTNLNTARSIGIGAYPANPFPTDTNHGTWVASVLAADGDNGTGITGATWFADLAFHEYVLLNPAGNPDTTATGQIQVDPFTSIHNLVTGGTKVANISLEAAAISDTTAADSIRNDFVFELLVSGVGVNTPAADLPLFVVSAGNNITGNQPEAYWTVFPRLADSLPGHVLVVTSSDIGDNLATDARTGRLVHVAAPGTAVTALDVDGSQITVNGTSFAAPHVSGLAALLFAFDTTLTVPEVRQLIIDGAVNGGRVTSGAQAVPIVNAYESLKLAAQRPGARLCGSRLWWDDDDLTVERGVTTETIATNVTGAFIHVLKAYHGGARIDYQTGSLLWENGVWIDTVVGPDPSLTLSGATNSFKGLSHDADSLATSVTVSPNVSVRILDIGSGGSTQIAVVPGQQFSFNKPAYSPTGETVYVSTHPVGQLVQNVYSVDIASQTATLIISQSGFGPVKLRVSEDGNELVFIYHTGFAPFICTAKFYKVKPMLMLMKTVSGLSGPFGNSCTETAGSLVRIAEPGS